MDPKIIKFYKTKGYRFSDFFDVRRHGGSRLTEPQVKAGGVEYYEKIQSGEITPRKIDIGWGVIEHAKNARFDDFVNDNNILIKYKPIIKALKKSLFTWKLCFWVMIGVSVFLGLAYIDIKWGFPI